MKIYIQRNSAAELIGGGGIKNPFRTHGGT